MTPKSAWENIQHLIPKDKVIWEAFFGDGKSGDYLTELGFNVIHEKIDFFSNNKGDIVISNPPFTMKKEVLTRLVKLDKPFILIMPSSTLNTKYIRKIFEDKEDKLKIIIPKGRIHFNKLVNGKTPKNWGKQCYFDTFYFCYKIEGLENDITWLN